MPVPLSVFEEIYRRHGHRCPMSTLGGRIGYAARRHFAERKAVELLAVCYAKTCAVDGIRYTTGCCEAEGNLAVMEQGRHALALVDREAGEGIEVALTEAALAMAGEYRRLRAGLEKRRPQLAAAEIEALEQEREKALDILLAKLRTVVDENLLSLRPVTIDVKHLPAGSS